MSGTSSGVPLEGRSWWFVCPFVRLSIRMFSLLAGDQQGAGVSRPGRDSGSQMIGSRVLVGFGGIKDVLAH